MSFRGAAWAIGAYVVLASSMSCGQDVQQQQQQPSQPPKFPYLTGCTTDEDCQSAKCVSHVCSQACGTDADCASNTSIQFVCGVAGDSSQVCVPKCGLFGYGCVNGVSTACSLLDQTHCDDCGCADALRCEPGVGCMPKSDVGGSCLKDEDCTTLNCGLGRRCRVALGSPCDATNCDACFNGGGLSYCSRECTGLTCATDAVCIYQAGVGYCYPTCDHVNCPGTCINYSDEHTLLGHYCDCFFGEGCTVSGSTHPFGALCHGDTACESGMCDSAHAPCDDLTCELSGRCTTACTSSNDCEAGYRCATAGGKTRCMEPCNRDGLCVLWGAVGEVGECTSVSTTENDTAELCLAQRSKGPCSAPEDCQSGVCDHGMCQP